MVVLVKNPDRPVCTNEIATALYVSENHLSKVLQRLVKAGLLNSSRGPTGGFTLARDAQEMTLLEVYEAVDGPMVQARCLFNRSICDGRSCVLGGLIETVNREVREHLERTTLDHLKAIELSVTDGRPVECEEKSSE
jgi:Rrf2 family protein